MLIDIETLHQMLSQNVEVKIREVEFAEKRVRKGPFIRSFTPHAYIFSGLENEVAQDESVTQAGSGVGVSVNLLNGGKDYFQYKADNLSLISAEIKNELSQRELVLKARGLYWDLVREDELSKIIEDYKKLNQENGGYIRKKINSGLLPESDLLETKMNQFEAEEERQQVKSNREKNQIELLSLLNSEKKSIEVNTADLDKLVKYTGNTPQFINLENELLKNEYSQNQWLKKQTVFWSNINLNFYSEYSFTRKHLGEELTDSSTADRIIGLKIVWNLLDEKNERSVEQQLKDLELKRMNLTQVVKKTAINSIVEKKKVDLKLIEDKLSRIDEKVSLAKKYYLNAIDGFKKGIKDTGALNDGLMKYIQAKRESLDLKIARVKTNDELTQ